MPRALEAACGGVTLGRIVTLPDPPDDRPPAAAAAARDCSPTAPGPRVGYRQTLLTVIGITLLALWVWWWFETLRSGRLALGAQTRIPAWRFLGLDFLHNFWGVRVWIGGGNPYRDTIGDWRGSYAYPPIVLPLYAWTALFNKGAAVVLWMGFIAAVLSAGGWMAWRVRQALNLARLPLVFVVGAVLCSMPAIFAIERGQGDAICLLMIVLAAVAVHRRESWGRDIVIGTCLAVAAWVKIYPAILIPGLLALRMPRALGVAIAAAVLIGIVPYQATVESFQATAQGDRASFVTEVRAWLTDPNYAPARAAGYEAISVDSHSLTTYWSRLWNHFRLDALARMPGLLGAALVLVPLALWVSASVWRSPARERLAFPYLLLLVTLATFGLPVSYDYNLIYLPLAALAVCDRRDGPIVAVALVGMLVWWQPFRVPWEMQVATAFALFDAEPPMKPFAMLLGLERDVLFFLKLFAAVGVLVSLAMRAREAAEVVDPAGLSAPMTSPPHPQGADAPA
ncbi:MAG: glycosyltransferase family 87 protein [Tepidisphaeraceae bacterium]